MGQRPPDRGPDKEDRRSRLTAGIDHCDGFRPVADIETGAKRMACGQRSAPRCRRIIGAFTGQEPADCAAYLWLAPRSCRIGVAFMPDRFAEIRRGPQAEPVAGAGRHAARTMPLAAVLAATVLAGALLAACSSSSGTSYSFFAEPGKYQYHDCGQLAVEMKKLSAREHELKIVMDRADQSAGGAAVGFIAYKAEYAAVSEDMGMLQSTARSKSCQQDETWRSNTVIR
jgi:hypothetical protein